MARHTAKSHKIRKVDILFIQIVIYIDKIDGDYNNVVGLPVAAIYRELDRLGIDPYTW